MAKKPGDGTTLDGVTQINVRLNTNIYRQVCALVKSGHYKSLSDLVRTSIVDHLNERI